MNSVRTCNSSVWHLGLGAPPHGPEVIGNVADEVGAFVPELGVLERRLVLHLDVIERRQKESNHRIDIVPEEHEHPTADLILAV